MADEWREVRRRRVVRPFPERNPVRQPYFPTHRLNPKPYPVGNWNGSGSPVRESSSLVRERLSGDTFFFNNFPEGCWVETLKRCSNGVGKVVDIFCPKKRDLKGKPFGFVRFEKGSSQEKILAGLNNIWIGSFKIRAYVPRFERPAEEKKGKRRRRKENQKALEEKIQALGAEKPT